MGNYLAFSEIRKKRQRPTLALGMMKCNRWKGNTLTVCLICGYFPAEEALGISFIANFLSAFWYSTRDLSCLICRSTENPVSTWVTNWYSAAQSLTNAPNRNTGLGYERRREPAYRDVEEKGWWEKFRKIGDLLYQGQKIRGSESEATN